MCLQPLSHLFSLQIGSLGPGEEGCAPPTVLQDQLWRQLVLCPSPSPTAPPLPSPNTAAHQDHYPRGPPASPRGVCTAPAQAPQAPQASVSPRTTSCPTPDTCSLGLHQGRFSSDRWLPLSEERGVLPPKPPSPRMASCLLSFDLSFPTPIPGPMAAKPHHTGPWSGCTLLRPLAQF